MAMRTGWDANGACGLRGSVSSPGRGRSRNDLSRTGAGTVTPAVGPGTVPGTDPGTEPGTTAAGGGRSSGRRRQRWHSRWDSANPPGFAAILGVYADLRVPVRERPHVRRAPEVHGRRARRVRGLRLAGAARAASGGHPLQGIRLLHDRLRAGQEEGVRLGRRVVQERLLVQERLVLEGLEVLGRLRLVGQEGRGGLTVS